MSFQDLVYMLFLSGISIHVNHQEQNTCYWGNNGYPIISFGINEDRVDVVWHEATHALQWLFTPDQSKTYRPAPLGLEISEEGLVAWEKVKDKYYNKLEFTVEDELLEKEAFTVETGSSRELLLDCLPTTTLPIRALDQAPFWLAKKVLPSFGFTDEQLDVQGVKYIYVFDEESIVLEGPGVWIRYEGYKGVWYAQQS